MDAGCHVHMFLLLAQVKKLKEMGFKPKEQLTLEPYERDHAVVVGLYRPNATAATK